jgi:purine nucleosidase
MKSFLMLALVLAGSLCSAERRLVVVDQDATGPGTTNQMALLALLESPEVELLGITEVTGDGWMDANTRHTLRMLELTGHGTVPVARGARGPLVRDREQTRLEEALVGKPGWLGAWRADESNAPIPEGEPVLKPIDEDAAHFLLRQVHAHPHQVTIYAGGPLTNIALAISLDPQFAALTKGLVVMGGSLNPSIDGGNHPRREFNFWFDPEAAHIVLRADWPRVDVTTVDASVQAPLTAEILHQLAASDKPAARYIARWSKPVSYMWDELAALAWIDPAIITREQIVFMDVDLSHGPGYGDTLTWDDEDKPATGLRAVHAQLGIDRARFEKLFVARIAGTTK